jgi:hypothetical protein
MQNRNHQSQHQMFYASAQQAARINETFLELVQSGMTKADLKGCIARRPALWSRFSHWLEKLPEDRPERMRQTNVQGSK